MLANLRAEKSIYGSGELPNVSKWLHWRGWCRVMEVMDVMEVMKVGEASDGMAASDSLSDALKVLLIQRNCEGPIFV